MLMSNWKEEKEKEPSPCAWWVGNRHSQGFQGQAPQLGRNPWPFTLFLPASGLGTCGPFSLDCFHLINSYSSFQSPCKCSFLKALVFSVRSGPYDKPPHTLYCPLWPVSRLKLNDQLFNYAFRAPSSPLSHCSLQAGTMICWVSPCWIPSAWQGPYPKWVCNKYLLIEWMKRKLRLSQVKLVSGRIHL